MFDDECLCFAKQVARCTKIIDAGQDNAKYVINVRQIAKFVVGLGEKVSFGIPEPIICSLLIRISGYETEKEL